MVAQEEPDILDVLQRKPQSTESLRQHCVRNYLCYDELTRGAGTVLREGDRLKEEAEFLGFEGALD